MPLHPIAQAVVNQLAAKPPLHALPIPIARQAMIDLAKSQPPGPEIADIVDRHIAGSGGDIPIRIYTPAGSGPFPILMYFHGGGWIIGNLDTDDALCRELTHAVNCIVISVNYRHAPEHKFPAAPEDAYAATVWAAQYAHTFNGDASRLAVSGTSAGGNLSAVVTLMARTAQHPRICYQVLRVPAVNHAFNTRSYQECGNDYGLDIATSEWFWQNYLDKPEDGANPYASPLRAADLSGLPPALVITAEYDPLRSEGEAYAQRLMDAGVDTIYRCHAGMMHLFLGPDDTPLITEHLCKAFAVAT